MQCGNQWLYPLSGAAIINDVVCSGQALLTRDLCGQYVLCLLAADAVAGYGSGQLSLAVDVNHQHAIGARLQVVLDQQWHHPESVGAGNLRQLTLSFLMNQRVQQLV
ncbi:hypothetical protein D3C72_1557810 [compost metagenome]